MPQEDTATISIPELDAIKGQLSSLEVRTLLALSDASFEPAGIIIYYELLPPLLAVKLRGVLAATLEQGGGV